MRVPVVLAVLIVLALSSGCSAMRAAPGYGIIRGTYQEQFDADTRACLLRSRLDGISYHWCLEDLGWKLTRDGGPSAVAAGLGS